MNVDARRYVDVNLLTYSDSTVIIVKVPIVALSVKNEISWVEIATNI